MLDLTSNLWKKDTVLKSVLYIYKGILKADRDILKFKIKWNLNVPWVEVYLDYPFQLGYICIWSEEVHL